MRRVRAILPGLAVAAGLTVPAELLGRWQPVVGAPVFGILLGIGLGTLLPRLRGDTFEPGYGFAGKTLLQGSIVVLGTGLSLRQVASVGGASLPVMLGTLAVALGAAWLLGRRLGLPRDVTTLIGVGTAICGASAIAAASAVLRPRKADVAYAIGTIFTCNIAAVLLFPPLGHLLGMSGHGFGLWAGTAINDTSSVVAAAYSYGDGAGPYGVVVKLVRSLAIVPVVLVLAHLAQRRNRTSGAAEPGPRVRPWQTLPRFIPLFLVAAALNSLGLVPAGWHAALGGLGVTLIAVALTSIGLGLDPAQLRAAGTRPLLLGGVLWAAVALASLALQALTGTG